MIKIIACRVDEEAKLEEIEAGLNSMKEIVGGYIEMIALEPGLCLVCNEEGKIFGLPANRPLGMDVIAGD